MANHRNQIGVAAAYKLGVCLVYEWIKQGNIRALYPVSKAKVKTGTIFQFPLDRYRRNKVVIIPVEIGAGRNKVGVYIGSFKTGACFYTPVIIIILVSIVKAVNILIVFKIIAICSIINISLGRINKIPRTKITGIIAQYSFNAAFYFELFYRVYIIGLYSLFAGTFVILLQITRLTEVKPVKYSIHVCRIRRKIRILVAKGKQSLFATFKT